MDLTVKLQVFEGPLDLLLYLLDKNKVNIYDIPIVEITSQYMEYVEEMRQQAGKKDSLDLEEMLKQNQSLFAGGTISEEAKDAYFQAVMKAYLDCKEAAKQTYGRKKDN